MFDKDAMGQMAEVIKKMSPQERQKRAGELKVLLDAEMKRRNMVVEAAKKKRGKVFEWLSSLWKDD
jgi:hypothetical protein